MIRFYDSPRRPSTQSQASLESGVPSRESGVQKSGSPRGLEARFDFDQVEVLHHVGLALHALGGARLGLAVVLPLAVLGPGDDLGVDEALLQVGVDPARRLERRRALPQVPA